MGIPTAVIQNFTYWIKVEENDFFNYAIWPQNLTAIVNFNCTEDTFRFNLTEQDDMGLFELEFETDELD